jgi:hypothetical protein
MNASVRDSGFSSISGDIADDRNIFTAAMVPMLTAADQEAGGPNCDEPARITLTPGAKRGEIAATLHGELGAILEWTAQIGCPPVKEASSLLPCRRPTPK